MPPFPRTSTFDREQSNMSHLPSTEQDPNTVAPIDLKPIVNPEETLEDKNPQP